ncbi:hypothetical protein OIV83_000066 [Microbotryomycetes sp. JL201]|nr:hypothetical protein OIV83_000066 [Microbotryomycetes sp. JL201]
MTVAAEHNMSDTTPPPTADVKLDKNGQPKKKRKQLQVKACQMRQGGERRGGLFGMCKEENKVRRTVASRPRRALKCTDTYVRSKPKVVRSGKLIQQAKKLYGAGELAAQQAADSRMHNGGSDLDSLGAAASMVSQTENARLAGHQISQALEEHLISTYSTVFQGQCYVVEWDVFARNWDEASHQSDHLHPTVQCLAYTMQAYAARFTDHPLIIGQDGRLPTLADIQNGPPRDLTEAGNRREGFARMMYERAMRKADEVGAWRKTSTASCVSFVLLGFLSTWCNTRRDATNSGRFVMNTVAEQLRAMNDVSTYVSDVPNEEHQVPERISGGTLLWTCYTRDALSAVTGGKALCFSDDDLATFSELLSPAAHAMDVTPSVTSTVPAVLSGLAVVSMFRHLTSIIRFAANKVTSPLSFRERLDEAVVRRMWAQLEENARLVAVFQDSVAKTDWGPQRPKSVAWFKDLVSMTAQALIGIHRAIVDRFELEHSNGNSGVDDPTYAAYLDTLRRIRDESAERFLTAIREWAQIVHPFGNSALWDCINSCEYLVDYLQHMIDMPTWEQGGPRSWTYAVKRREIGWMIDILKLMGWCWPNYNLAIDRAYSVLRECAAAEQAMSRLGPAHSAAAPSPAVISNGRSPYSQAAYAPPSHNPQPPYGARYTYNSTEFDEPHLQHNPAFNGGEISQPPPLMPNGYASMVPGSSNRRYYDPHSSPAVRGGVSLPSLPAGQYALKQAPAERAESNERQHHGSASQYQQYRPAVE